MAANGYKEEIIIKLGGSLIVPDGGLDVNYIRKFYTFIRKQVAEKKRRFFLLIGGGELSRHYRDAGAEITGHGLTPDDLDWIGIHVTRLNAHLFRTIFSDLAYPRIIKHYEFIQKPDKPIVIATGWKPGWSTDYGAVTLAQDYGIKAIIKMSNVSHVYDKDPYKYKDAKPFEKLSWKKYCAMIGGKWSPGQHAPIDPMAAKFASKIKTKVVYLNGRNLQNLEKAIDGKKFVGTIIE